MKQLVHSLLLYSKSGHLKWIAQYLCVNTTSTIVLILFSCLFSYAQCDVVLLQDSIRACEGNEITMHPIINWPGAGNNKVLWRPSAGCSDAGIAETKITLSTSGYYTIIITSGSANLLANGDFSLGDVGFSSEYVSSPPVVCATCPEGTYTIDTITTRPNPGWLSFGDHTSGTGKFMIINSAYTAPLKFWSETIAVTPNTNYVFSGWIARCNRDASYWDTTVLNCNINGNDLSGVYIDRDPPGVWSNFTFNWNSGTNTIATICLNNLDISGGGNDFSIDDLSFSTGIYCISSDSVYIDVIPSGLFMPTVFTPNGDGQNDIFYPRGSYETSIKLFEIYNRWGENLFLKRDFHPNDMNYSWDGMYKGERLNSDVFFYKIELGCANGEPMILKGDVTLVR